MSSAGMAYFIYLYLFLILILLVLVGIVLLLLGLAAFRLWKSKKPAWKAVALAISILILSFAAVQLYKFDFITDYIDSAGSRSPELCDLHYAFPLGLLGANPVDDCLEKAAIARADVSLCPSFERDCMARAIEAGARDCDELESKSARMDCYYAVALADKDPSFCDKLDYPSPCYEELAKGLNEAALCEESDHADDCILKMIRETNATASCGGISNPAYKSYCVILENGGWEACDASRNPVNCIARYSLEEGVCMIYEERGLGALRLDCEMEVQAISESDASVCLDAYADNNVSASDCIYWAVNGAEGEGVCDGLEGLFLDFCEIAKDAKQDGECRDTLTPVSCLADYSNDSSICVLTKLSCH